MIVDDDELVKRGWAQQACGFGGAALLMLYAVRSSLYAVRCTITSQELLEFRECFEHYVNWVIRYVVIRNHFEPNQISKMEMPSTARSASWLSALSFEH